MKKLMALSFLLISLSISVRAQVPMVYSGSHFENFDSLSNYTVGVIWANNATRPNWWAERSAGGSFNLVPGDGGSNSGNFYHFGINLGNTDRALGSIGSGTPGHFAWGLQLHNTSGTAITDMTITYVGEQWRDGGATVPAPQVVAFWYKTDSVPITALNPNSNATWAAANSLDFTSPVYAAATGTALNGNLPANRVLITSAISGLNIPDGHYIMIKWDDPNHTGNDHAMAIDSLSVAWVVPNTITTGSISGSPFCVSSLAGINVPVPYNISGIYNPGNEFKAYLSDANGSFAAEIEIGTLASQAGGTINATIPAGTPTGLGYRIRVKSTDPFIEGIANPTDLVIVLDVEDVTNLTAAPNYQIATLNFTPPPGCYDEVMLVGKELTSIASAPTGDGSTYIANSQNFTDPLNTVFDGTGKVVYKSATPASPVVITGLNNGILHYFKFFTRQGTLWSSGVEVSMTPNFLPKIVITEIMYDDPSTGTTADTLEFIEIYNNDNVAVDLANWQFSAGVTHTFAAGTIINPSQYLVIAKKATAVNNFFAISGTLQWDSDVLSNTGELIELKDHWGNVVDSVHYDIVPPWPATPAGQGPSLTLCDPNTDNSLASNWAASTEFTDSLNHMAVLATPGAGCFIYVDNVPPVAVNAWATSLSTVYVAFDEMLDQISAELPGSYTWLSAATASATLNPSSDTAELILGTPLISGITDTIFVTGISDTAGNIMTIVYKFPIVYGTIQLNLDTLVWWNFPATPDDQFADGGITPNLTKTIQREAMFSGTYSYPSGGPGFAISTTAWDGGVNSKYWHIEFTTFLYDSIRVSSKQYSSSTAPRDFKLEYSLNGVAWTPLPGADILCNSNWLLGELDKYLLPDTLYSQSSVFLRWLMASDSAVNGSPVSQFGVSRIDEIYVFGRYNPILGSNCHENDNAPDFNIYPNPSEGMFIVIKTGEKEAAITVYDITGRAVFTGEMNGNRKSLDLSHLPKGVYQISLTDHASQARTVHKVIIY